MSSSVSSHSRQGTEQEVSKFSTGTPMRLSILSTRNAAHRLSFCGVQWNPRCHGESDIELQPPSSILQDSALLALNLLLKVVGPALIPTKSDSTVGLVGAVRPRIISATDSTTTGHRVSSFFALQKIQVCGIELKAIREERVATLAAMESLRHAEYHLGRYCSCQALYWEKFLPSPSQSNGL